MYCQPTDCAAYVLQAYLDKIEEKAPGCLAGHIDRVSDEIDEALAQGGYAVPSDRVSATLVRICAVMAAWRAVGQITSLMASAATSQNEWLPLQSLHSRAQKDLDLIRAGKLDPFPETVTVAEDNGGIVVSAPRRQFDDDVWGRF
ncbi:MAG: phage protein Gp36 family protein [Desulfovibrionaceae bacterium]